MNKRRDASARSQQNGGFSVLGARFVTCKSIAYRTAEPGYFQPYCCPRADTVSCTDIVRCELRKYVYASIGVNSHLRVDFANTTNVQTVATGGAECRVRPGKVMKAAAELWLDLNFCFS